MLLGMWCDESRHFHNKEAWEMVDVLLLDRRQTWFGNAELEEQEVPEYSIIQRTAKNFTGEDIKNM